MKEAKRLNLDLLSLSETRLLGQGNLEINGYLLIWSGQEEMHQSGVAFLIKREHTRDLEIQYISDRVMKVTLKINGQLCTILGIYAPTNTQNMQTKLDFYSLLDTTIQTVPKNHRLFICGDFNARVGKSRKHESQWHKILGNYGTGSQNENGLLLLESCTKHNLRICNTFFKRKIRGTWQHPRSKKWHQLDHILCRNSDSHNNMVCFVDSTAECWTDHQMVILKQNIEPNTSKSKTKKYFGQAQNSYFQSKCLSSERLIRNLSLREDVGVSIDQNLKNLITTENYIFSSASSQFNLLSDAVYTSCQNILKKRNRKNAFWFQYDDENLDKLLQIRTDMYKKYLQHKTPDTRKQHQKIQRQVREYLRDMENKFWEKHSREMEQLSMRGNTHAFYKSLKTIYGPTQSRSLSQSFRKKDGTLTKSSQESLERLREYYSELLNHSNVISPKVDDYIEKFRRPTCWELDTVPTFEELIAAIKIAKRHKSGTDIISIEILQYADSELLLPAVHHIFIKIWESLELPEKFMELVLCSIFKKGDKTLCKNQRGISLISYVSKVLTLLLNSRLYNYCEQIKLLPESQCGFRKGRSTIDMIFTAKMLQQSCREKQIRLYLAFLDIAKAYDSVHRQTLWKILEVIGIPPRMLTIIKLLYGETRYRVKLFGKFSDSFLVKQGLKQGCPAACLLFNIFFAIIIHVIHQKLSQKGVEIRFRLDGEIFDLKKLKVQSKIKKMTITEMLFADDAALCAFTEEDLQMIVTVFHETMKEFGLELSIEKTQIMMQKAHLQDDQQEPNIFIDGIRLKLVHEFKYLGTQLQDNAGNNKETAWRIKQSSAAFSKLYQRIWKKKHISLKTKIKVYKTMITPCMIYGAESWNCNKGDLQKLNGLQYRHLRHIFGKKWADKVSHVEFLQSIKFGRNANFEWALAEEDDTKDPDLQSTETMIRLSRLRYFGHIIRMDDSRLPKIVLHSEINMGKRGRGRPQKNYRACIKEDLKCFGMETESAQLLNTASDRNKWRKLINQGAAKYQKAWEENRLAKSLIRKQK